MRKHASPELRLADNPADVDGYMMERLNSRITPASIFGLTWGGLLSPKYPAVWDDVLRGGSALLPTDEVFNKK